MAKVCPICKNRRHIFQEGKGWVRCQCVGQLRAYRLMSTSGFPQSLWEVDSKSYKPYNDAERQKLANCIINTVKNYANQFIFIHSTTTDKDRAAAIICRYASILNEDIKTISYITLDQLVHKQFGKTDESVPDTDALNADITVILIGREMTNTAHRIAFYSLLYDRILAEKCTILSSFVPKSKIEQVYQKAVTDLIEANFVFYSC